MNKIQKFIKDNDLSLEGYGSDLNSTCCIIAGYALYASGDDNNYIKLLEDIEENGVYALTASVSDELERVYDYAYQNNYFEWWTKEEARKTYIFEPEPEE